MTEFFQDKPRMLKLLKDISSTIENVIKTGMTTASDNTVNQLGTCFREASSMRLLRLGSSLRIATQEISRYLKDDPLFSSRRLSFFLNRCWLLCRGMILALQGTGRLLTVFL